MNFTRMTYESSRVRWKDRTKREGTDVSTARGLPSTFFGDRLSWLVVVSPLFLHLRLHYGV